MGQENFRQALEKGYTTPITLTAREAALVRAHFLYRDQGQQLPDDLKQEVTDLISGMREKGVRGWYGAKLILEDLAQVTQLDDQEIDTQLFNSLHEALSEKLRALRPTQAEVKPKSERTSGGGISSSYGEEE